MPASLPPNIELPLALLIQLMEQLLVLQVMVNRLLNWMLLEQRLLQCLELLEQQTIPETMTILQQIRT